MAVLTVGPWAVGLDGAAAEASSLRGLHAPAAESGERVDRTAWIMGTRGTISVEGRDRAAAVAASEAALQALRSVEDRLSTWRDDSELSRLNRTPPGQVGVGSEALSDLLAEVARWTERTDGAFHPAVGALIDVWGLRGEGRVPDAEELRHARGATGDAGVLVDATTGHVVRRDPTAWLDAGAFGKGAGLREARRALESADVDWARIDLGGQILVVGRTPAEVSVADPVHRHRPFTELRVADASVATSGQSERGIVVDGVRFGHVLDPRSGLPLPAWGSVTVVDSDPVSADVLATALFVLGPDAGLRFAESLGIAALFLAVGDEGVSEYGTTALDRYRSTPGQPAHHQFHPQQNE